MKLPAVRKALNLALQVGILTECSCSSPYVDWNGDKCGFCTLQEALRELNRAEGQEDPPKPSAKQLRLLSFIHQYQAGHGYPPTMREMADNCGWGSPSSVTRHLKRLEELGYIERRHHADRGVRILIPPEQW